MIKIAETVPNCYSIQIGLVSFKLHVSNAITAYMVKSLVILGKTLKNNFGGQ